MTAQKTAPGNYVTFACTKFTGITWDNGYSKEEKILGNYLWDELDKRCNYVSNASFMDYRFEIYFTINKKGFFAVLKGIDPATLTFGLSIWSTLNTFERFIRISDTLERSYIRQLIDDILRLDSSFTDISWSLRSDEELKLT